MSRVLASEHPPKVLLQDRLQHPLDALPALQRGAMATTDSPAGDAPPPRLYGKQVIDRILEVIRSNPIYDPFVEDEILNIAADCEPPPPAPCPRLYETREAALQHVKAFAAYHGYCLTVKRSDQIKVDFVCSRHTPIKARESHPVTRERGDRTKIGNDCPFRLQLRRRLAVPRGKRNVTTETPSPSVWKLRVTHGDHNHGPSRHILNAARFQEVSPEVAQGHALATMLMNGNGPEVMMPETLRIPVDRPTSPPHPVIPEDFAEADMEEGDDPDKEPSPPALPAGPPPAPPPGIFETREHGLVQLNDFAFRHGYSLTIKRSDTMKVDFICACWPNPEHPRSRKTVGTNCKFQLQLRRRAAAPPGRPGFEVLSDRPNLPCWELRVKNGEHNHGPQSPTSAMLKRKRKSDVAAHLTVMSES